MQVNGSLELLVDRQHHGAELSCRAANPELPDLSLQDSLVLHVYCKFLDQKEFIIQAGKILA
jgi:hypothetical protein